MNIANLLFEAKMLKRIPRSGFQFLGAGKASVADHSHLTTFIAYTMAQMRPDVDALRLISMCLVHDLPEARIGDLNYVQKKYVAADEHKAVADTIRKVPFGQSIEALILEFNAAQTPEARLARDADQLSFILELKALIDAGYEPAQKWLQGVLPRLQTKTGKKIADDIIKTACDEWWLSDLAD